MFLDINPLFDKIKAELIKFKKYMAFANIKEKITIYKSEYDLLNEVYEQFRRQALLMRVIESEKNLKDKKVKKMSIDKFIEKI